VTAGLILAAGESRRMGSPKALLQYGGETFLDRLIGLFEARSAPVIVVLGAGADQVRAATLRKATFVENAGWQRGQITSMQCGLRAAPPDVDGVLFTLVDHPAVRAETIDALLAAPAAAWLRVPRYREQNGHPIWFSRNLIGAFLALAESGSARDVVRAHAAETEIVAVDDPGVLADIDDPGAYRALIGANR